MKANDLSGSFTLGDDVLIIPVDELAEASRNQIECNPGDFAVSRPGSRGGSKIVDPETVDLLNRFRQPRAIVEAVILYGRDHELDPQEILEEAYPLLRGMVEGGFLVRVGAANDGATAGSMSPSGWTIATNALGATVLRRLQVLEDTEVYLLSRLKRACSVLKLERLPSAGRQPSSIRARLEHEALILAHLDGRLAPKLLGAGELDGRSYLELEYIAGVDAATVAAERRQDKTPDARRALLELAREIAATYAALHALGIAHGDVHPRNILVQRDGRARLIDFGLAGALQPHATLPMAVHRGGVPFFFEPELARGFLSASDPPPASEAGEQHAVASLIYFLATGAYWQDFRLSREEMLEDIASREALSFRDRGVPPWPELEAVLRRALSKQPKQRFPSLSALVDALAAVSAPQTADWSLTPDESLARILERALSYAAPDGPWSQTLFSPAPSTSLNYGSAGIALGLLHIAYRRGDADVLAQADVWTRRAVREIPQKGAFHNAEIEITPDKVGEASPYHSPSGVSAVGVLVGTAMADPLGASESLAAFLAEVRRPAAGLDLTLGRCSTMLGAAILLDAVRDNDFIDVAPLRAFGESTLAEIWQAVDAKPHIARADIDYAGIAHGWAGILYATMQWCRVSHTPLPASVEHRLAELADLALPTGRGLEWPWLLHRSGEPMTMAGWCNGTCGYIFLWTLAHRLLGAPRYIDLAEGAAWRSWEAAEPSPTLCCGLGGRAYALLNMYRHTGDRIWLERARRLAALAARLDNAPPEYSHSLYKGTFGLAVLAADLEEPDDATMPFFEPLGYRS
jgi:serine/threonine-protein kinase